MPERVSPYALLKSSKPRQPDSYVTSYDLYSAASQAPSSPFQASPAVTPAVQDAAMEQTQAGRPSRIPAGRTHYIADIKTRHSRAAGRTQMTGMPLSSQPPSSIQTPST